jgi:hypothetical protein
MTTRSLLPQGQTIARTGGKVGCDELRPIPRHLRQRLRWEYARARVVVGDGEEPNSSCPNLGHDLFRRPTTIGGGGMNVQNGAHRIQIPRPNENENGNDNDVWHRIASQMGRGDKATSHLLRFPLSKGGLITKG